MQQQPGAINKKQPLIFGVLLLLLSVFTFFVWPFAFSSIDWFDYIKLNLEEIKIDRKLESKETSSSNCLIVILSTTSVFLEPSHCKTHSSALEAFCLQTKHQFQIFMGNELRFGTIDRRTDRPTDTTEVATKPGAVMMVCVFGHNFFFLEYISQSWQHYLHTVGK